MEDIAVYNKTTSENFKSVYESNTGRLGHFVRVHRIARDCCEIGTIGTEWVELPAADVKRPLTQRQTRT